MNTEQKRFTKTMKKRARLTRKKNGALMVEVMHRKMKRYGFFISNK